MILQTFGYCEKELRNRPISRLLPAKVWAAQVNMTMCPSDQRYAHTLLCMSLPRLVTCGIPLPRTAASINLAPPRTDSLRGSRACRSIFSSATPLPTAQLQPQPDSAIPVSLETRPSVTPDRFPSRARKATCVKVAPSRVPERAKGPRKCTP